MKANNLKFKILFMAMAAVLFTAVSCKDEDDEDPVTDANVVFEAALNGVSEVPPNASTATGNATLTYDTLTKKFTIIVIYSGITATGAHIHLAPPDSTGGIVFPFATPLTSPVNYTSPALTDAQEADLFGEMYYVNIHSAAYPGGEIRGQLRRED
jgi:hypothetical protein